MKAYVGIATHPLQLVMISIVAVHEKERKETRIKTFKKNERTCRDIKTKKSTHQTPKLK